MALLKNNNIKQVSLKDFKKGKNGIETNGIKNGFVFVGASWCGYCKMAAPEIDKLANITGLSFPVFYVDGEKDNNNQLLNLLEVSGFPSIFIIYNRKLYKYEGERKMQSILSEMCKISNKNICFGF